MYENPINTIEWQETHSLDFYESDLKLFFNSSADEYELFQKDPNYMARLFVNEWTDEEWDTLPLYAQLLIKDFLRRKFEQRLLLMRKIPVQLSMFDEEDKNA